MCGFSTSETRVDSTQIGSGKLESRSGGEFIDKDPLSLADAGIPLHVTLQLPKRMVHYSHILYNCASNAKSVLSYNLPLLLSRRFCRCFRAPLRRIVLFRLRFALPANKIQQMILILLALHPSSANQPLDTLTPPSSDSYQTHLLSIRIPPSTKLRPKRREFPCLILLHIEQLLRAWIP